MTAPNNNQDSRNQDSDKPDLKNQDSNSQDSNSQDSSSQNASQSPGSDHWPEMIAGYVLGDLSSDEMAQVQVYLDSHPDAQTEVAELQATLNLLPLSLPEDAAPPASLNNRLLTSAATTPQIAQRPRSTQAARPASRSPQGSPRTQPLGRKMAWGAIVTATAVTLLGWQNLQLRQNLQIAQQRSQQLEQIQAQLASSQTDLAKYQEMLAMLRQPKNRLLALSGASGFTETSSGSVVIAPQKNWAVMTLKDLPAPPPGKAYQLWAMANGQKVYCIEFKPDATGQVLIEVPVDNWAGTPMLSITLEDEGTIPTQTSEMVMNGTVI